MNFQKIQEKLIQHFNTMVQSKATLFVTDTDKDSLWELYLNAFPEGTNTIFQERLEYDCNSCKSFIRKMGNTVIINADYTLTSIWDFETNNDNFDNVFTALSNYVKQQPIIDVFLHNEKRVGVKVNRQLLESGNVKSWNHFYVDLPKYLIRNDSTKINTDKATGRDNKQVLQRGFDEITEDAIVSVLELIQQNSLARSVQWKDKLELFLDNYLIYYKCNSSEKELFCWLIATGTNAFLSRIKNESIGTLLMNISSNMDLEEAVRKYETIVAGENYQRPNPVITKSMRDKAKKTVIDLGLMPALERRYATFDDLDVNNILFMNSTVSEIQPDIFDSLNVVNKPHKFNKLKEVSLDQFINTILPTANKLELYFEPTQSANLMTLITGANEDTEKLFSWENQFSWSYKSGLATSAMKQNVANAGGKVEGALRFSIQWNTENRPNQNDFDAHCYEPNTNHIYFSNAKTLHRSSGMLDVDIINPGNSVAVENIIWTDINKMSTGDYNLFVHNYSHNGGTNGFTAEIEFDGTIHQFDYKHDVKQKGKVEIAIVTLKDGVFSIKPNLKSDIYTPEVWNIKPNSFYEVSTVMYSPNYWESNVGNQHIFFMLPSAKCDESPRGFYNEFLRSDLRQHRKTFEMLGGELKIEQSDNQLTGLGFSRQQSFICKVIGNTERIIRINI